MAIDYHKLKQWTFAPVESVYRAKDTILYALSVGAGRDPLDAQALRLTYEQSLRALPTMAVVLGYPGPWMSDPASGIDYTRIVHGENTLIMHRPLPPEGAVVGRSRVARIVDKGAGKGAIVTVERSLVERDSGAPLATIEQVTFCRAEGGFSTSGQPSDASAPPSPKVPERDPDCADEYATPRDMALFYRLHADPNPLHVDPAVAVAAGFPKPILHGLATYGVAGLALIRHCGDGDPSRLRRLHARFTAPAFPGDTLRTEMWRAGDRVQFRVRAVERNAIVLDNGVADVGEGDVAVTGSVPPAAAA